MGTIERIDARLCQYHKENFSSSKYVDNNGIGKFQKFCDDNGYDSEAVRDELAADADIEDCQLVEFDDNFPCKLKHPDDKKKEIFNLQKGCLEGNVGTEKKESIQANPSQQTIQAQNQLQAEIDLSAQDKQVITYPFIKKKAKELEDINETYSLGDTRYYLQPGLGETNYANKDSACFLLFETITKMFDFNPLFCWLHDHTKQPLGPVIFSIKDDEKGRYYEDDRVIACA